MANKCIELANGASLAEAQGRSGQAALGYIPGIRRLAMPLTSAERLTYREACPCCPGGLPLLPGRLALAAREACPCCRKATEQVIAGLTTNYCLPCATRGCRHTIDLRTRYNDSSRNSRTNADLDTFLAER